MKTNASRHTAVSRALDMETSSLSVYHISEVTDSSFYQLASNCHYQIFFLNLKFKIKKTKNLYENSIQDLYIPSSMKSNNMFSK